MEKLDIYWQNKAKQIKFQSNPTYYTKNNSK